MTALPYPWDSLGGGPPNLHDRVNKGVEHWMIIFQAPGPIGRSITTSQLWAPQGELLVSGHGPPCPSKGLWNQQCSKNLFNETEISHNCWIWTKTWHFKLFQPEARSFVTSIRCSAVWSDPASGAPARAAPFGRREAGAADWCVWETSVGRCVV